MSAVKRGTETEFAILKDILPSSEFKQTVYRNDNFFSIEVQKLDGKRMQNFDEFFDCVKERFGEKLMEVYSITSDGVHFIIYVRQ